jgi:hypothetical protein
MLVAKREQAALEIVEGSVGLSLEVFFVHSHSEYQSCDSMDLEISS